MRGERLRPGEHGTITTKKIRAGKWVASGYYMTMAGERKRVRATAYSEAAASRALLSKIAPTAVAGIHTTEDLITEWLKRHDGISKSTRESYQGSIDRYIIPAIGRVRIEDLSTPVIDEAIRNIYVDHSKYAAKRSRTLLRMACKWAARVCLIERDYTHEVPVPGKRGSNRIRPWAPSDEQIALLCELLRADYEQANRYGPRSASAWLAAELMRTTGARIGEVCAVQWDDVDWESGTITYGDTVVFEEGKSQLRGHLKNSDPYRTSFLPLPTLHLLRQHRQDGGPIVAARGGVPMQTANLRRVWRRVYDAAGVPANERVRPHDLRRSAGTKLTAALGIDAASAQLGDTWEITERHYVMPSFVGPVEARKVLE